MLKEVEGLQIPLYVVKLVALILEQAVMVEEQLQLWVKLAVQA